MAGKSQRASDVNGNDAGLATEPDELGVDHGLTDPSLNNDFGTGTGGTDSGILYPKFGDPTNLSKWCFVDGAPMNCEFVMQKILPSEAVNKRTGVFVNDNGSLEQAQLGITSPRRFHYAEVSVKIIGDVIDDSHDPHITYSWEDAVYAGIGEMFPQKPTPGTIKDLKNSIYNNKALLAKINTCLKQKLFFQYRSLDNLGFESSTGSYESDGERILLIQSLSFNPLMVDRSVPLSYRIDGDTLTLIENLHPHVEDLREGTVTNVLHRVK